MLQSSTCVWVKKKSFAFVLLFGGFQASRGRSQAAVAEDAWRARKVRKASVDSFLKFLRMKEEWEKLCVKRENRIERKQENKKSYIFWLF